ncbi:hypothetical protein ES5_03166 [Dietzia cinnamea P4]|nr:hypothetical protein ES5_03166 [Dietzia cinnamea P4]
MGSENGGSLEPGSAEGSLAPSGSLTASLAPLGSAVGSLPLGSLPLGSAAGSLPLLVPAAAIGGSVAAGPMMVQVAADLGIALPPLPGSPAPVAVGAVVGEAPPAPGPSVPNGRGGEPGVVADGGGAAVGVNAVVVTTGSLGDYHVVLPDGVSLPPLPFNR